MMSRRRRLTRVEAPVLGNRERLISADVHGVHPQPGRFNPLRLLAARIRDATAQLRR